MSSPINPDSHDPFDKKFYVERIDEDKSTREDKRRQNQPKPSNEKLAAAAFLLELFRKTVDSLLASREASSSIEETAKQNLQQLRKIFEILQLEDRSEDVPFLNHLAATWQRILQDSLHFKKDALALKFKNLIQAIQHFPPGEPHSLGYYLTEYAGQKWVPFPYMELIQKIHTEHEGNSTASTLALWISQIDELDLLLKNE